MRRKLSRVGCARARRAVGVLAVLWLLPVDANAFIPSSTSILASVAKRRASLAIDTLVAVGTAERGQATAELWEAIRSGVAHRIERKTRDKTQVTLVRAKEKMQWEFDLAGGAASSEKIPPSLTLGFLGTTSEDPSAERALAFLDAHGIAHEPVTLARLDREIAYVIGAKPGEIDKPQLWIHKDLRVPIRFIRVDRKTSDVVDVRLHGFGSPTTGVGFPKRIETWRNGKLDEVVTYRSVTLNEEIDPATFEAPSAPSRATR